LTSSTVTVSAGKSHTFVSPCLECHKGCITQGVHNMNMICTMLIWPYRKCPNISD
jgi:hypothetical protein